MKKPALKKSILLFGIIWALVYVVNFCSILLAGGFDSATLGGWTGVAFVLIPLGTTLVSVFITLLVVVVVVIVSAFRKQSGPGADNNTKRSSP